jgi:hypothetical protein
MVEAEELYQQWHEVPEDLFTNCDDVLKQRNMLYPSPRSWEVTADVWFFYEHYFTVQSCIIPVIVTL